MKLMSLVGWCNFVFTKWWWSVSMACRVNAGTIGKIRGLKGILNFIGVVCRFNCLLHKLENVAADKYRCTLG
jgi:hypothetical protein